MLILLVVDLPSIFAMGFYVGFCWPECLPTFICPDGINEVLMIMVVHAPTIFFWLVVGFGVGKSRTGKIIENDQQG